MADTTRGPLVSLRVLDLTTPLGQATGRYLADLGADVIKIEPPEGDPARRMAPFAGGTSHPEKSLYFLQFNTNKRGIVSDLATSEGRQIFLRLVRTADVVLESFTPGYLPSLGLDYEALARQRPGLVLTSITPFGQTGPYSRFKATDLIADAMGGVVFMEGEPGQPPCVQPYDQAVQMTGLHAAFGTLIALWHRLATGEGQHVDVSLQEVVAHEYLQLLRYSALQDIIQRTGRVSYHPAENNYPCADGWVMIYTAPQQWKDLAQWAEDPVLLDPKYEESKQRNADAALLDERLAAFTRSLSREELLAESARRRIASAPLNTVQDLVRHPHTVERHFLVDVDHPVVGRYKAPGPPAAYGATPWLVRRPAPTLGQHTQEILAELDKTARRGDPSTPPKPPGSPGGRLPLEGVRILDFTRVWAGPFGTRFLADFGAEVIKVESGLFGEARQRDPATNPTGWRESAAMYAEPNRNKLSISVDLHTEAGQEIVRRLAAVSDVVTENYYYATLPRWGLGYEDLRKVNPRLIMVSCPGYGSTGPARDAFAYGGNISAFAGLGWLWGYPGSPADARSKQAYPDFITSANLALAVMAGLHHRRLTGEGQHVELNQADAAAQMVGTAILAHTINGINPEPRGNRDPNAAPQGIYPCRGADRWCAISCTADEEWMALCRLMGRDDLASDGRFTSLAGRQAHHDELDREIAAWTRQWTPHQVMLKCQVVGVPAGVVASGEDLYLDPHLRERGYIVEVEHPVPGRLEHPGMTVRLTRTPGRVRRPAPTPGQHTEEVLCGLLGLPPDEYQSLVEAGVID